MNKFRDEDRRSDSQSICFVCRSERRIAIPLKRLQNAASTRTRDLFPEEDSVIAQLLVALIQGSRMSLTCYQVFLNGTNVVSGICNFGFPLSV